MTEVFKVSKETTASREEAEDLAVQAWQIDNPNRNLDEVFFSRETKKAFVFTFVSSEV